MDSDHLSIASHASELVRTQNHSNPVEKFTDLERFQSLASKLISPRIRIISWEEADKMTREFTAFITSACRLSDMNSDLAGLAKILAEFKEIVARNPGSRL
jgi:hypothetical protein